jgi:hypothetical protein
VMMTVNVRQLADGCVAFRDRDDREDDDD